MYQDQVIEVKVHAFQVHSMKTSSTVWEVYPHIKYQAQIFGQTLTNL